MEKKELIKQLQQTIDLIEKTYKIHQQLIGRKNLLEELISEENKKEKNPERKEEDKK